MCHFAYDIVELNLLSLGTLVQGIKSTEALTRLMLFLLVLRFYFTHRDKHTQDTQEPMD